jgi:hypothetical protein
MKNFILSVFLLSLYSGVASAAGSFEENLYSWLLGLGFQGKIHEVEKNYNEVGFINDFYLLLEETQSERISLSRQKNVLMEFKVNTDSKSQALAARISNKDISDIPYMEADWIARLAIRYVLGRISSFVGVELETQEVSNNVYLATLLPAKTSQASRFRFDKILVYYSVNDLILNLDVFVYGPSNYLVSDLLRGELNALLRSLERGSDISRTIFEKEIYESPRASLSDRLLMEFLQQP